MSNEQSSTEAQQAAELENLENEASREDYQPDGETLNGEYEPKAPTPDTSELCTALLSVMFSLVAARRGEHWRLSATEAQESGKALGAALDKYFPDMTEHGVEITLILCLGGTLAPRLMIDHELEKQMQKSEQKAKHEAPKQNRQPSPPEKEDAPRQDLRFDMEAG